MTDQAGWASQDWRPLVSRHKTRVRVPTTTTTFQVITGEGSILVALVEETTGIAGARFELWDGVSTAGEYLGPFTLGPGQSFDDSWPPHGIPYRSGVFLNVTAGSIAGVMHIGELVPVSLESLPWGVQ